MRCNLSMACKSNVYHWTVLIACHLIFFATGQKARQKEFNNYNAEEREIITILQNTSFGTSTYVYVKKKQPQ